MSSLAAFAAAQIPDEKPVPPPSPPPGTQEAHDGSQPGADAARGVQPPVVGNGVRPIVSAPQLFIRVEQDPVRIAPGETGVLLLVVGLPRGCRVDPGGQVVFDTPAVPLSFGAPVWDPPPQGGKGYTDTILIRVPVSVGAGTPHQRVAVSGKFSAPGSFPGSSEAVAGPPGAMEEAAAGDPAGGVVTVGLTASRAEQAFAGNLVIGRPVPRPGAAPPRRASSETGSGSEAPSSGPEPGAATSGAAGGQRPAPVGIEAGLGEPRDRDDSAVASEEGEAHDDGGLPIMALVGGAAVVLLVLALVLRGRR